MKSNIQKQAIKRTKANSASLTKIVTTLLLTKANPPVTKTTDQFLSFSLRNKINLE